MTPTQPEREFPHKTRRWTSPPQNRSKWLVGYDGVEVIMETEPDRIAYFAREASWADIMEEPDPDEFADTLAEIGRGGVLGVAYKGGMGFRIRASRSCMDQMLRLAEGRGGAGSGAAAQTTRDSDMRDFNIIVPHTIEALAHDRIIEEIGDGLGGELYSQVSRHITEARRLYGALVDAGVPYQDARFVAMPLGFQTQWVHVMSAGNLIALCETRLCNLVQHETDYLVRVMRDLAVQRYPWLDSQLRSACEKAGHCVSSQNTMGFPPCGAFIASVEPYVPPEGPFSDMVVKASDDAERLEVTKWHPDRQRFSADKNSAMEFAEWDIERNRLEAKHPDVIYCMSGPPHILRDR